MLVVVSPPKTLTYSRVFDYALESLMQVFRNPQTQAETWKNSITRRDTRASVCFKALFQYPAKTDKTLLRKEKHQCKLPWQIYIFFMLNNFNSMLHNNTVSVMWVMKGVGGCGDRYFDHEKDVFILRATFEDWPVNGLNSEMKHCPFQWALQFASWRVQKLRKGFVPIQ